MGCFVEDPWVRAGELEDHEIVLEHDQQATTNPQGEGGKARKSQWDVY
jgi:hypothetical protein